MTRILQKNYAYVAQVCLTEGLGGGFGGARRRRRASGATEAASSAERSAQVLGGLEEQEFPPTARYSDVFNDTSVHWFPVQKLQQLPSDAWACRAEPDYRDCEDLEIIRCQAGASAAARQGRGARTGGGGQEGLRGLRSSQCRVRGGQETLGWLSWGEEVHWERTLRRAKFYAFLSNTLSHLIVFMGARLVGRIY